MRLPHDVERARELVLEHGWNATSYQIVNPGITHWFASADDAVVGHVEYAGYRVVAGAPVCARERLAEVVDEFESDSRRKNRRICYFGAEARLDAALAPSKSHSRALLGAQPAWDPAKWSEIVRSHSSLRAQLNRARNKGVAIVEFSPDEAMSSDELNEVLTKWLASRGLPPLHFLVEPDTLDRLADRRIFVARQSESVVAFAVLSPIPARNGWLVEQFPRVKAAPNGTIELLLTEAVTAICESGASYVTLGLAPLARRTEAHDEPRWLRMTLNFAAAHGRRFYNFRGLESFKAKFHPETWEPVYAIADSPRFPVRALFAIGEAFLLKP
jgi:phosphatidylglycerol lysyltransferase